MVSGSFVMTLRNSYKILEVGYGASVEEVKRGYKDLVRVWHPDRFTEDPRLRKKAEEKMKEINRAYAELMTFFSSTMTMVPPLTRYPYPRWWIRGFWGIGVFVERICRRLYRQVYTSVNRIELGRIYQVLFNFENGLGAINDAKDLTKSPPDQKGMYSKTDGFHRDIDFRSIFDEVASTRRAQAKKERPPYKG